MGQDAQHGEVRSGYFRIALLLGVACVVAADFIVSIEHLSPFSVVLGFLLVAALGGMFRFPRLLTAVFLAALVASALIEGAQLASFLFLACVYVGLVAARGRAGQLAVFVGFVFVIGLVDRHTQGFDPLAALVWAAALAVFGTLGWVIGQASRQRRRLRQAREEALRNQRLMFATALHDSVIAQLTSVIMKAQAVALEHEDSPELSDELEVIALRSREAMAQLRDLVELTRGRDEIVLRGTSQLNYDTQFRHRLEEQGFEVVAAVPPWDELARFDNREWAMMLKLFLSETATNILKYAAPRSEVSIALLIDDQGRETLRVRSLLPTGGLDHPAGGVLSTKVGLPSLETKVALLDGDLRYGEEEGTWIVDMVMPADEWER